MRIFQRLYWAPRPEAEARGVIEAFRQRCEKYNEGRGASGTARVATDTLDAFLALPLPAYVRRAEGEAITRTLGQSGFAQVEDAMQAFIRTGFFNQPGEGPAFSGKFGFGDTFCHVLMREEPWLMATQSGVLWRTPKGEANSISTFDLNTQKEMGPEEIAAVGHRVAAAHGLVMDAEPFEPCGLGSKTNTFHLRQAGLKETGTMQCVHGLRANVRGNFPVERADWKQELERAYRAVVTLNEKSEPLGATVNVSFSSYEGRNYWESWKRARELLPEGFARYEVGYIYMVEGLEDLDFTRRALTPEKPVAEIELGRFRHTADFDDHPDMAAEGLLQLVVTREGLGVAVDLHNGPLPEALAKVFPGGLEEVLVGEIPGFRKGKVVKKTAAKKKAAKKGRGRDDLGLGGRPEVLATENTRNTEKA